MDKLLELQRYAKIDAGLTGLPAPDTTDAFVLAKFLEIAGRIIFLGPDDPIGDNRRRSLFISVFLRTEPDDWRREVLRRLHESQMLSKRYVLWWQECETLAKSATDADLAKIMLSSDENSTRVRISFPVLSLLRAEQVLWVKHHGILP